MLYWILFIACVWEMSVLIYPNMVVAYVDSAKAIAKTPVVVMDGKENQVINILPGQKVQVGDKVIMEQPKLPGFKAYTLFELGYSIAVFALPLMAGMLGLFATIGLMLISWLSGKLDNTNCYRRINAAVSLAIILPLLCTI